MSWAVWKPRSPHAKRNDAILAERAKGKTFQAIARKFGLSRSRVEQIVYYAERRERWRENRAREVTADS